jgi:hypothetical protein
MLVIAAAVSGAVGCKSNESKECQALFSSAQDTVQQSNPPRVESIERSLSAVGAALVACEKAGLDNEASQLKRARSELSAQRAVLEERAAGKPHGDLLPSKFAALEKQGDPACPKGQAYKHRYTGKEIRCTGPQIVDMSWEQAKNYFRNRGFSLRSAGASPEEPATLKAEYGGELFVFNYSRVNDNQPPKCLKLYPPPGTPWEEAASRATGVAPNRLKPGTPIQAARGNLELDVDRGESKLSVHIGDC